MRPGLVVGTSNHLNLARIDNRDVGFWLRGEGSRRGRFDISELARQGGRLDGGMYEVYKVGSRIRRDGN